MALAPAAKDKPNDGTDNDCDNGECTDSDSCVGAS